MSRPNDTRPETDPGEAPSGARAYGDRPVSGRPQGGRAPGASEPGDMGSPEGTDTAENDPGGRERPNDRLKPGGGYRGG
ncbi:hypothetical protein [Methylobacterium gregans]|uniref:Uncharacterized protein n=1 Tax=Methylobacterium gregans TaxID=374424 RepID=A0AA37MGF7_9HYPH|nr:hypothetical protein [Methylobacterium gregans]MDQ0521162.1 hypothetical protein [Methylobacterium gregans]GJD81614.1 hypothetical protein NBEOAGPD_4868 [Methylobacterium gregans]GLS54327.1 hypothetical protein GCM10007886_25100 [Methylobacterium gregans]